MAWCLAIRWTPSASTTARMAGKPSGTAATASDTPSSSTCTTSAELRISEMNRIVPTTTMAMTTTARPSVRPMRATSLSSGVGSGAVASSSAATSPIWVSMPVAVMTARPVPCATAVPLKTMSSWSPSAAGWGSLVMSFSTASLSPVSAASCKRSVVACSRRASAPTASPSASTSTSPRTNSALGTRCGLPSRSTPAVAAVILASAATAFCALASCTWPITALSSTTAAMTIASTGQPTLPSTHQATSATATAANNR